ncbi:MAG: class I SAM-dependent methyltransferase family protein [Candidatus Woesearchaeota archaeon]
MKAVKVPLKDAEGARMELASLNIIAREYALAQDKGFLFIPVKADVKGYEVVDKDLQKYEKEEGTLLEALKGKLSEKELEKVPRAFDTVGDIAIVEINEALKGKEKLIGETLLRIHKNINVVAKKSGFYEGEFRTRKVEVIAGEERKTTEHKENNVRLRLNVETCYFSPRLGTERRRVYEQVKKGERVLVMFSGVGPYPLSISKNTEAKDIVGVEINPYCHKHALENVLINDARNVKLYLGDVKEVVPKLGKFDRILMPLPKSAEEFLDTALLVAKKGTVVHFYDFEHENDIPKASVDKVVKHWKEAKVLEVVKCGQYSPGKFRVCVDFEV